MNMKLEKESKLVSYGGLSGGFERAELSEIVWIETRPIANNRTTRSRTRTHLFLVLSFLLPLALSLFCFALGPCLALPMSLLDINT